MPIMTHIVMEYYCDGNRCTNVSRTTAKHGQHLTEAIDRIEKRGWTHLTTSDGNRYFCPRCSRNRTLPGTE